MMDARPFPMQMFLGFQPFVSVGRMGLRVDYPNAVLLFFHIVVRTFRDISPNVPRQLSARTRCVDRASSVCSATQAISLAWPG